MPPFGNRHLDRQLHCQHFQGWMPRDRLVPSHHTVTGEHKDLPTNSISLPLPVFFFPRFLLYGGKGTSICLQLSLVSPGRHRFVNLVIIDLLQNEMGLLLLPRGCMN